MLADPRIVQNASGASLHRLESLWRHLFRVCRPVSCVPTKRPTDPPESATLVKQWNRRSRRIGGELLRRNQRTHGKQGLQTAPRSGICLQRPNGLLPERFSHSRLRITSSCPLGRPGRPPRTAQPASRDKLPGECGVSGRPVQKRRNTFLCVRPLECLRTASDEIGRASCADRHSQTNPPGFRRNGRLPHPGHILRCRPAGFRAGR